MMEHIFREFANRGINPFGHEDTDSEDDFLDGDADEYGPSLNPVDATVWIGDEVSSDYNTIEVRAGQTLCISINNVGKKLHTFTIGSISVEVEPQFSLGEADDLDIHVILEGGDTAYLEFAPQDPGDFESSCTCEIHSGEGSLGVLSVV